MRPTLMIVIASTRPGRVGLPVARWFERHAREHGAFELDVADLAEVDLPMLDEPNHPRLRQYQHDHTQAWSARVDGADAFVFVTPEYNAGLTAPLKNAIDYLHHEWKHKPVGFVSYGGVSAGMRAVQMIKQVVTCFDMLPLYMGVAIPMPFVPGLLDEDRQVHPNETMLAAATALLDELVRAESALRTLRQGSAAHP